jgi:acetyl-CoA synthetase
MDLAWTASPDVLARSVTARFMREVGIDSYAELVARSVQDRSWFWEAVIRFLGIPFSSPFSTVVDESRGKEWATWFVGGRLNLSAVCVDRWAEEDPGRLALIAEKEGGGEPRRFTFADLQSEVARWGGLLQRLDVRPGEAVAVFLPMSAEAVVAFLAVARIGAIFVPIFSGFGADAIATRLTNPKPKVLICADGFSRRGRLVEMKEVADLAVEIAGGIDHLLVVAYSGRSVPLIEGRDVLLDHALAQAEAAPPLATESESPVMIAYTSGTTGRPKGSVHVHGGLTVKVAQEGAFQLDAQPGDRLLWATDMGWIMGPWSVVAALANGAAVATYDGAPDHPHSGRLWELAEKLELTILGISPTLIRALQPHGTEPVRASNLSKLRIFGSTGEPWNPDPWWWLFGEVGGRQIPIVNISGGTEVGACILSVNLMQGLKPTSLGGPSLGMAADVFDSAGNSIRGEVGELVVKESWPGMTRGFWDDQDRYLSTYWQRWKGVWAHGDWATVDDDGFWFLHGRSDDTLNIAGKRIGPAEIESAVVAHPQVTMAAAIGIPDVLKGEVPVIYAVTTPGLTTSRELAIELSEMVEARLGRAFRPKHVLFVSDLPRTRSAKIMRRLVKALALGKEPGDLSSLENPQSLDEIVQL